MYFDQEAAEQIEAVEQEAAGSPEAAVIPPIGAKLSEVVAGWTLSEEQRAEYQARVVPILDLLEFDDAMGHTTGKALPPWLRITLGVGVMGGMAFVMRQQGKKHERGKKRVGGRSTGHGEKRLDRSLFESVTEQGSGTRFDDIHRSFNPQPKEATDPSNRPPASTKHIEDQGETDLPSSNGFDSARNKDPGGDAGQHPQRDTDI